MTHAAAALVLTCCAIGTYAFRGGIMLMFADRAFPPVVERALQNVGPAVLAALTVNLAVSGGGGDRVEIIAVEVGALAIACGVAIWRKHLIWTLLAGMVALWVLSAL